MTDDITRYDAVEGYCGELSCRVRDRRWRCTSAVVPIATTSRSIDGEAIDSWCGAPLTCLASSNTIPVDADSNGCNWPVAVNVPIDDSWRSGFYLVTLPRPRRSRRSCGVATPVSWSTAGGQRGAGLARDRHEHLQRLQQLGRLQPVHGRQASLVRPAVRARDADAAVDRTRRSQVATGVSAARSPTSTD